MSDSYSKIQPVINNNINENKIPSEKSSKFKWNFLNYFMDVMLIITFVVGLYSIEQVTNYTIAYNMLKISSVFYILMTFFTIGNILSKNKHNLFIELTIKLIGIVGFVCLFNLHKITINTIKNKCFPFFEGLTFVDSKCIKTLFSYFTLVFSLFYVVFIPIILLQYICKSRKKM